MAEIIYFNNRYVAPEKACLSLNDRGFQFADGVYEVIKFYKSKPFRYNDHITRLVRNLKEVKIEYTQTGKLEQICNELINLNGYQESYAGIYIQITRGSHQRMHAFPVNIRPTICINSFLLPPRQDRLKNGIKVITRPDIRWLRCDIKSVSLLANVLAMQEAEETGAGECIFIRNGKVTEGTHSNIIAVKNDEILTHPDSEMILPGITKMTVRDICRDNKIIFNERSFSEKDLRHLDELMVTGTGNEITPVIQVNDIMIGDGNPGPVTKFIQKKFFEMTYENLGGEKWTA